MPIKSRIRTIPDWPKKGIMFRDVTTLLKDAEGFRICIDDLVSRYSHKDVDLIVGIDARGFTIGGALAYKLGKGLVLARKRGKLPAETEPVDYELEYGSSSIEIHKDAIRKGHKVVIIDDLLATGGTALATAHLVKKLGGEVIEMAFIIDLPDIGGGKKLKEAGYNYYAQVSFEGN